VRRCSPPVSRPRPWPGSTCSAPGGTPPTPPSPRPPSCACRSRCRPASAATPSRWSTTRAASTGSTPRGPRRARRRRPRWPPTGPGPRWSPARCAAGRRSTNASAASGSTACSRRRSTARAPASPPASTALPDLGDTLARIAQDGPDVFYEGAIARAIAGATWLEEDDLAAYDSRWVTPLSTVYRGTEVFELPPPTQGIAALEGLALLERLGPSLLNQVRAAGLALEDAFGAVRDGADVRGLLDPAHLAARAACTPVLAAEPPGGTVYLCCVDGDGLAVSFIQSLFEPFGSGVVVPGTGIVMNNRAACFSVQGAVSPGQRSYHTIIPGMLRRDGRLLGPFGVMGGYIQAQAHVQLVSALVDDGLDPQAALDRGRFRIDDGVVRLEHGLWDRAAEIEAAGLTVVLDESRLDFGGGQVVVVHDDHLEGGSDQRKDGFAAGL
jgi:gamma-glutamyltranspeptidase / glutathione hydrolase